MQRSSNTYNLDHKALFMMVVKHGTSNGTNKMKKFTLIDDDGSDSDGISSTPIRNEPKKQIQETTHQRKTGKNSIKSTKPITMQSERLQLAQALKESTIVEKVVPIKEMKTVKKPRVVKPKATEPDNIKRPRLVSDSKTIKRTKPSTKESVHATQDDMKKIKRKIPATEETSELPEQDEVLKKKRKKIATDEESKDVIGRKRLRKSVEITGEKKIKKRTEGPTIKIRPKKVSLDQYLNIQDDPVRESTPLHQEPKSVASIEEKKPKKPVVQSRTDIATVKRRPKKVSLDQLLDNQDDSVKESTHVAQEKTVEPKIEIKSNQDKKVRPEFPYQKTIEDPEDGEEQEETIEKPPTNVDSIAPSVSFVIPKKKLTIVQSEEAIPKKKPMSPHVRPTIRNVATILPSPVMEETVVTKKRTKSIVPLPDGPPNPPQEERFLQWATTKSSFRWAAAIVDANTKRIGRDKLVNVSPFGCLSNRFQVWDTAKGMVFQEPTIHMKCPSRKEIKKSQYPPSYFGIHMNSPSAAIPPPSTLVHQEGEEIGEEGEEGEEVTQLSCRPPLPCFETLTFHRSDDRDWYQQLMYGVVFTPQLLRARTTLKMRNARYVRQSRGMIFNSQRLKDEFETQLKERFTMNRTIPRIEIPFRLWQQELLNGKSASIHLHYQNLEDAALALNQFTDDDGKPFISSRSFDKNLLPPPQRTRSRSHARVPQRSRSRSPPRVPQRSRSRSPFRVQQRSQSRSQARVPQQSRSPVRVPQRSQSRSQARVPQHSRSQDQVPQRSRSRSPPRVPQRSRSRSSGRPPQSRSQARVPQHSRSPDQDQVPQRSQSRSPPRAPQRSRSRSSGRPPQRPPRRPMNGASHFACDDRRSDSWDPPENRRSFHVQRPQSFGQRGESRNRSRSRPREQYQTPRVEQLSHPMVVEKSPHSDVYSYGSHSPSPSWRTREIPRGHKRRPPPSDFTRSRSRSHPRKTYEEHYESGINPRSRERNQEY